MTWPEDHRDDLAGRADIDRLVRAFYERALVDPILAPAFETLAVVGLEAHLPVVADFWEQILFRTTRYHGEFVLVHQALNRQHGLAGEKIARWLQVWCETVDDAFAGPDAERAKSKAVAMAGSLERAWNRGN